jgi:pyocin large subunit-like protein
MKPIDLRWLAAASALALVACDGGASAVPARDHSGVVQTAPVDVSADPRDAPAPLVDGKPMWSANSKHTAEENAAYHFERDGAAFGAKSMEAFVRTAHDFIASPPKGALTLTRANGDRLIYDPQGNVFAVATKDGAPRTMFKPDDGMAYWEEQKARESKQAKAGSRDDRG